jgi:hypothetical protein
LAATSRVTVDAARPKRRAIPRIESPTAKPREISSRSVSDNRIADHSGSGTGRRNLADATWVRIVDGGRLNRRLIDRNDSPPSNRSQISVFSDSDNLRITHLHNKRHLTLVEGVATIP